MAKRYLLTLGMIALLVPLIAFSAWGDVPQLINFQGRLTDAGGVPLEGDHQFEFYLYDQLTEGSSLWYEAQTLSVTAGVFNAQLGSQPPGFPLGFFDTYDELYLEIHVKNEVSYPPRWEILIPRTQIISAAFSMRADNADKLGGLSSSSFALDTHTHEWVEILNVPAEADPTVDDSVKDGVAWNEILDRPLTLDDGVVNWIDIVDHPPILGDGEVTWNEITNRPPTLDGGIDWSEITGIPAGFADGTDDSGMPDGTPENSLPRWDGTSLVPGGIFSVPQWIDDGGVWRYIGDYVGIDTNQPAKKLDVRGDAYIQGAITTAPIMRHYSLGPFDFSPRQAFGGISRSINRLEGNFAQDIYAPISITFSEAMDFAKTTRFIVHDPQATWATNAFARPASATHPVASESDTATIPVAGVNNVGNGTVSTPTTGPSTVNEGWTLVCVSPISPARFSVTGTLSGTHLNAVAGVPYTSDNNEVSFQITEGSTLFALGDSFTFYTNNGNYGNGWVSTPTTGSSTNTEGWTLVCVEEGVNAKFSVTGTVSGIHADAVVHQNYSSNNGEVVFRITAGSTTAFVIGDIFTFNTINATIGNGTVSTPTTGPNTITEVWTLVCVEEGSSARFSVTGTVSGAHEDANVGVPYSSNNNEVSFQITAGSTAFVVGDSFTFTTYIGKEITGARTYEDKTAKFYPTAPLNYSTTYNVQIETRDFGGNSISHGWSFTTIPEPAPNSQPATVVATSPDDWKPVEIIAPLHLPHGAKIRKLSVYGDNANPNSDMAFFIFRSPGGKDVGDSGSPAPSPAEDIIWTRIPAAAGQIIVFEVWDNAVGKGVIDNENYSYSVLGVWIDFPDFDEHLYRVWIDYEIESPLP